MLWLLFACGSAPESGPDAGPAKPPPAAQNLVATATDAPPAFVNEAGQLACPVMGDVIKSAELAAGHLDHDGRRYYFCCSSCEVLMRENPELYADGRYLREQGKLGGGESCPEDDPGRCAG